MNKKALEMGFAWMFAIVVGGLILFLAIFSASKFITVSEKEINTKTAQAFLNILDKVQTETENGASDSLQFNVESRIYTSCYEATSEKNFGETVIEFSEKNGLGDKYTKIGGDVSTKNSYLFAENEIQGSNVNFLLFPVYMPFKVADITIAYTENYCFVNPPDKVAREVRSLGGTTISIVNRASDCNVNYKKVCFNTLGECGNDGIEVKCDGECERGMVMRKDSPRGNIFVGKLLYGAIFSSTENYECNTQRIVKRLSYLSKIYSEKANFVSVKGCNTDLGEEFVLLNEATRNYNNLGDLANIKLISDDIDNQNEVLECQLY